MELVDCSTCHVPKSKSEFHRNKSPRGHNPRCKECANTLALEWKRRNPHLAWARSSLSLHALRGSVADFSLEWLVEKAKKTKFCPWCGCELNWSRGARSHLHPSLDRIKPGEKFMTKESIEIVCWRCNSAKGTDSLDGYLSWLNQDRRVPYGT